MVSPTSPYAPTAARQAVHRLLSPAGVQNEGTGKGCYYADDPKKCDPPKNQGSVTKSCCSCTDPSERVKVLAT